MLGILIGAGLAAGTYWYAKNQKKASTPLAALTAGATGLTGWGAVAIVAAAWPILLGAGAVGVVYTIAKKGNARKALPPAGE